MVGWGIVSKQTKIKLRLCHKINIFNKKGKERKRQKRKYNFNIKINSHPLFKIFI